MKETSKAPNTNILLWKFLAVFVVVIILFNIDYKNLMPAKKEAEKPEEKIEPKQEEVITADDLDLEDYLLDEIDKEILETIKIEQIKNYRKYLVNTSLLLRKFAHGENIAKETRFLISKSKNYPKEVVDLLKDLQAFNEEYLENKPSEYEDLKLCGNFFKRMLGTIFDIKKANPKYKTMIEEEKLLKIRLGKLESYFYSVEFLKAHLSYD